jgi:hypothetical protein
VDFRVIDIQRKQVLSRKLAELEETIAVDSLSKENYLAVFTVDNQRLIKKLILNKARFLIEVR